MAAFLIVEGLTGSLLAFNPQLERVFSPGLYAKQETGTARLSLGFFAERAEKMFPQGQVDDLYAYPDRTMAEMETRASTPGSKEELLGFDQLFFDPWTGKELGRRRYGDLSEGPINIMPFVYDLHAELASGPIGELILGIVALIWTVDCFVAYYLTLPSALHAFWRRWKLAWRIKWNAGAFRLNFDAHRASGLWLWPLLLVFAWSSVMLALPSVYDRVMGAIFDYRPAAANVAYATHLAAHPRLTWVAAERRGALLLAEQARLHGVAVIGRPNSLAYRRDQNVYSYGAGTNLDIRGQTADSTVWLDADTGALRRLFLPSRQHAGNTVSTWLLALHFADLKDSWIYRAAVCTIGLAIAVLALTGIYIWLAKRNHRRAGRRRAI